MPPGIKQLDPQNQAQRTAKQIVRPLMQRTSRQWETARRMSPRKGANSKYPSWKSYTRKKSREVKYVYFLHLHDSEVARLFAETLAPYVKKENCELPLHALPSGITFSQIQHRLETQRILYLLLDNDEQSKLQASLLLKSLPERLRRRVRSILLLKEGEVAPANRQTVEHALGIPLSHILRPQKSDLNIPRGSQLLNVRQASQYRRIAREIAGTRLGLVLSSGGAKGFAYIGVLKVLEQLGLEFDVIAGSSVGAVIAALWAKGYDANQLSDHANKFGKWMHLRRLFDHVMDIRKGLLKGNRLEKYLRKLLKDANFTDLSTPLVVTATDVVNLRSVLINDGDVASALHASIAIPGICIPCQREGETFIDGGVSNPLPVHTLRQMGIENILAVSTVFRAVHGYEMRQHREHAELSEKASSPLRHKINARLNLFANGNAFDILMRSFETAHGRMVEPEIAMADLVIEPHPPDSRWQEFLQPDKYLQAGLQSAEEHTAALKQLEVSRKKGMQL